MEKTTLSQRTGEDCHRKHRAKTTMSQLEIANAMGISHTRVQQIEARALRKIRKALIDDGYIVDGSG